MNKSSASEAAHDFSSNNNCTNIQGPVADLFDRFHQSSDSGTFGVIELLAGKLGFSILCNNSITSMPGTGTTNDENIRTLTGIFM